MARQTHDLVNDHYGVAHTGQVATGSAIASTVPMSDGSSASPAWTVVTRRLGSGTATVTSGNTSVVVTHGAGITPDAQDIMLHATNSPTADPLWYWVDTITSTQFTINVRVNPGASGASFAWRVDH